MNTRRNMNEELLVLIITLIVLMPPFVKIVVT